MTDTESINLKETVNLPQTDFPIRAGLPLKEPDILKKWENNRIYDKIKQNQSRYSQSYVLHDGPPYPNGNIHLGHALNKILKDIVVRSKLMQGYKSPYIPGWDCHGLPIETQVLKALQQSHQEEVKKDIPRFRAMCKEFALDYVKTQKEEFIRLGIFGEWDNPYLTLNPSYEAKIVELFGQMAENGLVFRGKKPIHWCPTCETALAEAEIEYADHRSPSIYIRFSITKASDKLAAILQNQPASILVWTTTPWTLPANVAISAHPDFIYSVVNADGHIYLLVSDLLAHLQEKMGWKSVEMMGSISGKDLMETVAKHPFIDRDSVLITGRHVTAEDGTGFVHTAPGHGVEDYVVGQEFHLPIVMPVDGQGRFTQDVPQWAGQKVFDANRGICQLMEETGSLIKLEMIKHAYPHCWRCKNPVIFRATEQWFIAMDRPMPDGKTLREKALESIRVTKWYPDWGEKRITAMIENRPDWCISRQRFWGLPVPIFTCAKCNHPEMTGEFNKAAIELVKKEGATAWFSKSPFDILPKGLKCSQCGSTEFNKEKDILDVWFESGSSFGGVLETYDGLSVPAQMYLEGSDQHRGWFQSSLLVGLGARNKSPFENVLTHGFLTDDKGRKMSKSMGNVIAPQSVIKEYGADILRWWAASTDFQGSDISIAKSILDQARDSFSKTRNTIRFLLSNLYDFEEKDLLPYDQLNELDQWILAKLNTLIGKVRDEYNAFEFHQVTYKVHDFCAVTLSSLYLDMVKDRLYCDAKTAHSRRSTQTALYYMADALIKLIAPILVFTSEEAYGYFNAPNKAESIHLTELPLMNSAFTNPKLEEKFEKLLIIRDQVYQKLEELRNSKTVRSFLEAAVDLTLTESIDFTEWNSFLIVSQVIVKTGSTLAISVYRTELEKCERCWKYADVENGLCSRCKSAIMLK